MRAKACNAKLFALVVGYSLFVTMANFLWSQSAYPTKPIDLLISYAPGASGDLTERPI
jgi:tripartite-type tricarboxylate transporter receptor subunit TctC